MSSLRGGVKARIEAALVASGAAAFIRRTHAQQLLVLAYHNIAPSGSDIAGDQSLHLPQDAFAAQLDALLETHDVVSLHDAVTSLRSADRRAQRPLAAITFDDAYSGALTAGVAELRRRDLPATVFITPGFLDGKAFWWDSLSDPVTGLDPTLRGRALAQGRGLLAEVLPLANDLGVPQRAVPSHARGASTDMLAAALDHPRLTFGAHTWNHPNLMTLSDDELAYELTAPLQWLGQFGDRALPMISYPYGLTDDRVQDAARNAGYVSAFMIDGGWTTPAPHDRLTIPRMNVPAGVTRNGFTLRTAGVLQG